ncbi:MAG: hypothetical protein ACJ8NS_12070 [Chthoniobacterales bacterium]
MRITAFLPTHDLAEEAMPWMEEVRTVFHGLVIFIDERRVTPGTIERAEKVATRVCYHRAESWYEWDLGGMARQCEADWAFLIERDEQLSPEWHQNQWRRIFEETEFTHFWILRRWVVSGGRYIDCAPWWPDFQLRFFRTDLEGMTFPTRLHDRIHAPGRGASFQNLTLRHHVLWLCSRATREERVRYYDELREEGGLGHFYLYEDYSPRLSSLPEPVRLDIAEEVSTMDKLRPDDVLKFSFKIDRVPEVVGTSQMFWLNVEVSNDTPQIVCSTPPFAVCLAYHWREKATRRMVLFEGDRSGLFPGVPRHATMPSTMVIRAPGQPGEYILQITIVQEGVRWFEDTRPDILQEFPILVASSAENVVERPKVEFTNSFPCGLGKTERAVEIPWVLSRYNGEQKVLEVGCSFTCENPEYIEGLTALNIPELHGIDISAVEAPHFIKKTADIRDSGYENGFFDLVLCVSTIEHVGRDNAKHYKPVAEMPRDSESGLEPDVKAMVEMFRILKQGGRLLVTVPFGKFVDYGWFINYDLERVNEWFRHIAPERVHREYFKYTSLGWVPCSPDALTETAYGDNSAPAAAGLACFEITK